MRKSPPDSSEHTPRENLLMTNVGTRTLVGATTQDGPGNALPPSYGRELMGRITFNADGRMMPVMCDGRRSVRFAVSIVCFHCVV